MAEHGASTDSGEMLEYLVEKKVKVSVCSCSHSDNVKGLIQQIKSEMQDVVESVKFQMLPYNIRDMNAFNFSGIDVLLLCHSIESRRFSLTNVTDALYDGFLPKARKCLGKTKVGVVAHDFPKEALTAENLASQMASFRHTQETTFESSSTVLIGGQLSQVPVGLTEEQLNDLKTFFRFSSSPPPEEVVEVYLRRRKCILCLPCAICCMICCPCCRPRQNVGCLAFSVRQNDPSLSINDDTNNDPEG